MRKVVLMMVLVPFYGCSKPPSLTGTWESANELVIANISTDGDLFRVEVVMPKGVINGTYSGKYQDGEVKLEIPLCGNLKYSKESNKIYLCSEELTRMK